MLPSLLRMLPGQGEFSVFLLAAVGIGLLVSSVAATMQQAMLFSFVLVMPFTLLAGLTTPLSNMPKALQYVTLINPLRYAIDITQRVYLEGAGLSRLIPALGRWRLSPPARSQRPPGCSATGSHNSLVTLRERRLCSGAPAAAGRDRILPHLLAATRQGGMCTMQCFYRQQRPGRQSWGWLFDVWLSLLVILASSVIALTSPLAAEHAQPSVSDAEAVDTQREHAPSGTEDLRVIFAQARAWQERGDPFPDAILRQAVEAALQPEASWEHITAAITAFDVYKDRPWVTQVLQPFVVYHAAHILLNADVFARMPRGWTQRAIEVAAPQAPGLVLGALKTFAALDPVWAKQLAAAVVTTTPAVVWPHVDVLLAVDVHWAEGLVREAAMASPYDAVRAVSTYHTAPWGPQFFADVVLREPRWVVSMVTSDPERHAAVRRALDEATYPALQILAQLVDSSYPADIKERMAVFVEEIAEQALSFEAAAQLSSDAHTYFRTLVVMHLRHPDGRHRAIERALSEEVSTLVEEINSLFEQPAAVRFRAVETLTARELYLLLTYGEAEMFMSSYRGVFERLLTRMHQEGLTGDQLLAEVHHLRGKNMTCQSFWRQAEAILGRNPRFVDYVSPDKHAGVVFLTAYRSFMTQK